MVAQTSYEKDMRKAINGQVAWDFGTADITSANAEATVPFGVLVKKGTAERSAVPGAPADAFGIAVRSLINQRAVELAVEQYGVTETVAVQREGYVFLTNQSAATVLAEGESAWFSTTGVLVAQADVGSTELPNSRIESGAAVGSIALVRVKF